MSRGEAHPRSMFGARSHEIIEYPYTRDKLTSGNKLKIENRKFNAQTQKVSRQQVLSTRTRNFSAPPSPHRAEWIKQTETTYKNAWQQI